MSFLENGIAVILLATLTFLLSKVSLGTFFHVGADPIRLYCSARLLSLAYKSIYLEALGLYASTLACLVVWATFSIFVHLAQQSPSPAAPRSITDDGPWLLPCRTTHSRQFPKKHSFSYSYLQLGFRVGPSSIHGRLLKIEKDDTDQSRAPWTWFSISSTSYLTREQQPTSLRKKLDLYLESEGVDPKTLPNAYLVTAPRFLGYSFNPVSFWYLYDNDMKIQYMILEVNNTFDERRPYLLKHAPADEDSLHDDSANRPANVSANGSANGSAKAESAIFRQQWAKDFHVSPFNSRKGTYALAAAVPTWTRRSPPCVGNAITLRSSKAHGKLVARLFSTEPGRRVDGMGARERLIFVLAWCWVGFATFPRILAQAARLFFARRLHVWFRPEVRGSRSMGRNATSAECVFEWAFVDFVDERADALDTPVRLFRSWRGSDRPLTFAADTEAGDEDGKAIECRVDIHVLSPAFFVQYARDPDLVFKAAEIEPEARTFAIEGDGESIRKLFAPDDTKRRVNRRAAFWTASPTSRVLRPLASRFAPAALRHPLHHHVWKSTMKLMLPTGKIYARAVYSLLLGDVLFFGVPEVLDALLWASKTALALTSLGEIERLVTRPTWSISAIFPVMWSVGFLITFLRPQPGSYAQILSTG